MKGFVIVLVMLNLLVFGLGQGLFGTVRSELGRDPTLAQNQLNTNGIKVLAGRLQTP